MTEAEKKVRRKQWNKIIARWKREKVDRTVMRRDTLDDEPEQARLATINERVEYLMKLRWMNYGPNALYGRLDRILTFGQLPPSAVPGRGRRRRQPARPRKSNA